MAHIALLARFQSPSRLKVVSQFFGLLDLLRMYGGCRISTGDWFPDACKRGKLKDKTPLNLQSPRLIPIH